MKILTQYSLKMPVDLVIGPKNMKNYIGQHYVQLLHQTEKYRTVTSKQCNGDKFKKCPYTATLVWSIFAKIDKSNVAVERLFFKLSMDPLVGNDCPISIFSGLGGHGLIFLDFGQ